MRDGGLRQLVQKNIPEADWCPVETSGTGRGVPDLNYCLNGYEGWIECKATDTRAVDLRPEQVAWLERRARAGGRVTVMVRRKHSGGPRKGDPVDEIWVLDGAYAQRIKQEGLHLLTLKVEGSSDYVLGCFPTKGMPAKWGLIAAMLIRDSQPYPFSKLIAGDGGG